MSVMQRTVKGILSSPGILNNSNILNNYALKPVEITTNQLQSSASYATKGPRKEVKPTKLASAKPRLQQQMQQQFQQQQPPEPAFQNQPGYYACHPNYPSAYAQQQPCCNCGSPMCQASCVPSAVASYSPSCAQPPCCGCQSYQHIPCCQCCPRIPTPPPPTPQVNMFTPPMGGMPPTVPVGTQPCFSYPPSPWDQQQMMQQQQPAFQAQARQENQNQPKPDEEPKK